MRIVCIGRYRCLGRFWLGLGKFVFFLFSFKSAVGFCVDDRVADFDFSSMIAAFMAVNTYLIDAFTMYAASAMAANTILRSVRMCSDCCLSSKQFG